MEHGIWTAMYAEDGTWGFGLEIDEAWLESVAV